MASRRLKLAATFLGSIGAGYLVYSSVFAVQGEGTLAQAPMNIETNIPPAFILALDDSGSMLWEVLNNTRDGVFSWNGTNLSFFNGATPWGYGSGSAYHYQIPYNGRDANVAIPPINAFGFARSPDVNPAYFDPRVVYSPWKTYDRKDYMTIDPANAPVDPRPAGSTGKSTLTYNLTADVSNANNNYRFQVYNGMVLPKDTVVYRIAGCSASPALPGSANQWVTLTQDTTINASCSLGIRYFPATFYLKNPASLPAGYGYTATPVAVTNPAGGMPGTLYKYEIKLANFGNNATAYNNALQNFANWFSFYRTRREAVIGATTNALVDVNNMRVGTFWINDRRAVTMYDMSNTQVGGDREKLFNFLYTLRASGSTPTRTAVDYMGKQFKRDPRTDSGAPVQLVCQKNAGMLFTDGYINEGGNTVGNLDANMGSPFADGYSGTMADIVVPYYLNSLVPGFDQNAVKVADACKGASPDKRLDCQTNLHMNFYGVVLGSSGKQYGVKYIPDDDDPSVITPDPYTNPPVWDPPVDLAPQAVDEMWHATMNARGQMINAKTPALVTSAMRQILTAVGAGASPSGSIAVAGARVGAGSVTVSPFYESKSNGMDWYGTLTGQKVSTDPATRAVKYEVVWEASAKLPAPAARNVWFGQYSGSTKQASRFSSTNVTLAALCNNPIVGMSRCSEALITDRLKIDISQAVNYLLGDQSLEDQTLETPLRPRTTRLGDIVNATPLVITPLNDYGYRSLGGSGADPYGYAAYLETKKTRKNLVFAGANDGMFHVFDGTPTTSGGKELFGYIPTTALGHMGNLLFPYRIEDKDDQVFRHRYYVDGPIASSDAYYGGGWKTVAVASTGAGGRSVFALNVSNPSSFTSADVLWEVNDRNANTAISKNIGHVLGKPVIVPVKTTSGSVAWKAIFGNGYNSDNGNAVLFIVDVATGAVTTVQANETAAPVGKNGLGNIVVLDRWGGTGNALTTQVRDGYADTVYAADQKGAVWKFDLRSSTPATQTVPVFTTNLVNGKRQPILGGLAAAAGQGGGVMVFFGTGSFSFEGDGTDKSIQSIYGVLDLPARSGTVTRANLFAQTILSTSSTARITSTTAVPSGKLGWYLDLPAGERVVGNPSIESGVLFIPSYFPNTTAGCDSAGSNWLYGLNALSGGAALSQVRVGSPTGTSPGTGTGATSLNTGGSAPVTDVAVLTSSRGTPLAAGAGETALNDALSGQCSMVIQAAGAQPLYMPRACGRQSWRQIK